MCSAVIRFQWLSWKMPTRKTWMPSMVGARAGRRRWRKRTAGLTIGCSQLWRAASMMTGFLVAVSGSVALVSGYIQLDPIATRSFLTMAVMVRRTEEAIPAQFLQATSVHGVTVEALAGESGKVMSVPLSDEQDPPPLQARARDQLARRAPESERQGNNCHKSQVSLMTGHPL